MIAIIHIDMKRRIIISLLSLAAFAIVLTVVGSFYMLSYGLSNENKRGGLDKWNKEAFLSKHPEAQHWIDSILTHHALRDTFLRTGVEDSLHVYYIHAKKPTHLVALLVHGYKDNALGMLHIGHMYANMGYNVVLPDLHGHGASSGDDIQMGWKDRTDVQRSAAFADSIFHTNRVHTAMVLHGISMGAATVMCVSGEQTPPFVRCFVEDCGYTSVWDEFKTQLREQFSLPPFPLLYTTSALCKLRYGWTFGEASPISQLAKSHKPMLFIHGSADTYVPFPMVYKLYKAKSAPKELWVTRGSKHAKSYQDHRVAYTNHVKTFLARYMSK